MNIGLIVIVTLVVLVLAVIGVIVLRRRPRKLKTERYMTDWRALQDMCREKTNWPTVITQADELLDRALKRRRAKGKTMGERLVSVQRILTDNDDVWFAHNLAKKILSDDSTRLKEADVKDALVGFRQALRDLGALPSSQKSDTEKEAKA